MTERMLKRSHTVRDATVEEVALWCIEQQLDATEVHLAGVTNLVWESQETQSESVRRYKYEREQAERLETWERQTLARLKEKYEA